MKVINLNVKLQNNETNKFTIVQRKKPDGTIKENSVRKCFVDVNANNAQPYNIE